MRASSSPRGNFAWPSAVGRNPSPSPASVWPGGNANDRTSSLDDHRLFAPTPSADSNAARNRGVSSGSNSMKVGTAPAMNWMRSTRTREARLEREPAAERVRDDVDADEAGARSPGRRVEQLGEARADVARTRDTA